MTKTTTSKEAGENYCCRRGLFTSSPPQLGHIFFMAAEHAGQNVHS
jgi:hypothetical protein